MYIMYLVAMYVPTMYIHTYVYVYMYVYSVVISNILILTN